MDRASHPPHRLLAPALCLGTAAVVACEIAVLHTRADAAAVRVAAAFDLVVAVPLAWAVALRGAPNAARRVATVTLASATVAALVVPGAGLALRALTAPLEVAVLVGAGLAVRRALQARGAHHADAAEAWETAVVAAIGDHAVARFVAAEASALHYALGLARRRAATAPRFTVDATRSAAFTWGLVLVTAIEGALAHLAFGSTHPIVAWGSTILGLYAALWLVGQDRAIAARAIELETDELVLRVGLRLTARIPWGLVARVERPRATRATRLRASRYLDAARPNDPNLLLVLRRPVPVSAALGTRRCVKRIGLCVDDPEGLERAILGRGRARPPHKDD